MYVELISIFTPLWWKCLCFVLATLILVPYVGTKLKYEHKLMFANWLGFYLIFDCVCLQFNMAAAGNWALSWALPLQFCNVMGLIAAIALVTRWSGFYETCLFLGVVAPFQAIITPGLAFPAEGYFLYEYFCQHTVTILAPIFLTIVLGMRPRPGTWWRASLRCLIFLPFLYLFNMWVGGNYMYLMYAPPISNPLIFGPWPTYLILWIILLLAISYIINQMMGRKGKG